MLHVRTLSLVASVALVAGCGGSDDAPSGADVSTSAVTTTTTAATTTVGGTPTTEPEAGPTTLPPEEGIDSYTEIQPAVIQIEAMGTIRDPEVGLAWGGGRGSGFIISEDGLAVTNNHVVTGAATLEVFIGGDGTRGYNATVVGVSECNDLALIRIITDEPLPYLEWVDEAPSVGTEIYAAGFPLGDPEYTLTRGIVAKAEAQIADYIVAVDWAIEHDANLQPGNSGGPLVDTHGRLAGVNFYAPAPTNTSQFFAISSTLAQRVIDELRDGDFESLGINGVAVADEASGIYGVWVRGTAPGSPASDAGILPGDVVTMMNGLPIAVDGTVADYCDVIRTAGDRPINVEILRFDSQEVLRGEINGELPLEQVFSFAEEIDDDVDITDGPADATYSGYITVVDDTGTIVVDVPVEWSGVDTVPLDDGTPWLAASTDLGRFYDGDVAVSGMFMMASDPIAPNEIAATIDDFAGGGLMCAVDEGLEPYEDPAFTGQYRLWAECGDVGSVNIIIVANADDGTGAMVIGVQLVTDADFDALDAIISSFDFTR
jgi:serine protease Do